MPPKLKVATLAFSGAVKLVTSGATPCARTDYRARSFPSTSKLGRADKATGPISHWASKSKTNASSDNGDATQPSEDSAVFDITHNLRDLEAILELPDLDPVEAKTCSDCVAYLYDLCQEVVMVEDKEAAMKVEGKGKAPRIPLGDDTGSNNTSSVFPKGPSARPVKSYADTARLAGVPDSATLVAKVGNRSAIFLYGRKFGLSPAACTLAAATSPMVHVPRPKGLRLGSNSDEGVPAIVASQEVGKDAPPGSTVEALQTGTGASACMALNPAALHGEAANPAIISAAIPVPTGQQGNAVESPPAAAVPVSQTVLTVDDGAESSIVNVLGQPVQSPPAADVKVTASARCTVLPTFITNLATAAQFAALPPHIQGWISVEGEDWVNFLTASQVNLGVWQLKRSLQTIYGEKVYFPDCRALQEGFEAWCAHRKAHGDKVDLSTVEETLDETTPAVRTSAPGKRFRLSKLRNGGYCHPALKRSPEEAAWRHAMMFRPSLEYVTLLGEKERTAYECEEFIINTPILSHLLWCSEAHRNKDERDERLVQLSHGLASGGELLNLVGSKLSKFLNGEYRGLTVTHEVHDDCCFPDFSGIPDCNNNDSAENSNLPLPDWWPSGPCEAIKKELEQLRVNRSVLFLNGLPVMLQHLIEHRESPEDFAELAANLFHHVLGILEKARDGVLQVCLRVTHCAGDEDSSTATTKKYIGDLELPHLKFTLGGLDTVQLERLKEQLQAAYKAAILKAGRPLDEVDFLESNLKAWQKYIDPKHGYKQDGDALYTHVSAMISPLDSATNSDQRLRNRIIGSVTSLVSPPLPVPGVEPVPPDDDLGPEPEIEENESETVYHRRVDRYYMKRNHYYQRLADYRAAHQAWKQEVEKYHRSRATVRVGAITMLMDQLTQLMGYSSETAYHKVKKYKCTGTKPIMQDFAEFKQWTAGIPKRTVELECGGLDGFDAFCGRCYFYGLNQTAQDALRRILQNTHADKSSELTYHGEYKVQQGDAPSLTQISYALSQYHQELERSISKEVMDSPSNKSLTEWMARHFQYAPLVSEDRPKSNLSPASRHDPDPTPDDQYCEHCVKTKGKTRAAKHHPGSKHCPFRANGEPKSKNPPSLNPGTAHDTRKDKIQTPNAPPNGGATPSNPKPPATGTPRPICEWCVKPGHQKNTCFNPIAVQKGYITEEKRQQRLATFRRQPSTVPAAAMAPRPVTLSPLSYPAYFYPHALPSPTPAPAPAFHNHPSSSSPLTREVLQSNAAHQHYWYTPQGIQAAAQLQGQAPPHAGSATTTYFDPGTLLPQPQAASFNFPYQSPTPSSSHSVHGFQIHPACSMMPLPAKPVRVTRSRGTSAQRPATSTVPPVMPPLPAATPDPLPSSSPTTSQPLAMVPVQDPVATVHAHPDHLLLATNGVVAQREAAIYNYLVQHQRVPEHVVRTLFGAMPSALERADLLTSGVSYLPACKACSTCRAGKSTCELRGALEQLNQMLLENSDPDTLHRQAMVLAKMVRDTKALDAALPGPPIAPAGRAQAGSNAQPLRASSSVDKTATTVGGQTMPASFRQLPPSLGPDAYAEAQRVSDNSPVSLTPAQIKTAIQRIERVIQEMQRQLPPLRLLWDQARGLTALPSSVNASALHHSPVSGSPHSMIRHTGYEFQLPDGDDAPSVLLVDNATLKLVVLNNGYVPPWVLLDTGGMVTMVPENQLAQAGVHPQYQQPGTAKVALATGLISGPPNEIPGLPFLLRSNSPDEAEPIYSTVRTRKVTVSKSNVFILGMDVLYHWDLQTHLQAGTASVLSRIGDSTSSRVTFPVHLFMRVDFGGVPMYCMSPCPQDLPDVISAFGAEGLDDMPGLVSDDGSDFDTGDPLPEVLADMPGLVSDDGSDLDTVDALSDVTDDSSLPELVDSGSSDDDFSDDSDDCSSVASDATDTTSVDDEADSLCEAVLPSAAQGVSYPVPSCAASSTPAVWDPTFMRAAASAAVGQMADIAPFLPRTPAEVQGDLHVLQREARNIYVRARGYLWQHLLRRCPAYLTLPSVVQDQVLLTHWLELVTADPAGVPRGLQLAPAPAGALPSTALRDTVALPGGVVLPSPAQYAAGCASYDLCSGGTLPALRHLLARGCSINLIVIHDIDPEMRGAALVTLARLHAQHPALIAPHVYQAAVMYVQRAPHDVNMVDANWVQAHMRHPCAGGVLHVAAGIDCRDVAWAQRSPRAGTRVLSSYSGVLRILGYLFQMHVTGAAQPSALTYFVEHTVLAHHDHHPTVRSLQEAMHNALGPPLLMSSSEWGGVAHRVRHLFTNMFSQAVWDLLRAHLPVEPAVDLQSLAGAHALATAPVFHADPPPFPAINQPGAPRRVLGTVVSSVGSYNERPHQVTGRPSSNMFFCFRRGAWLPPGPRIRAIALNFHPSEAVFPPAPDTFGCMVYGQAIDNRINQLAALLHALQCTDVRRLLPSCRNSLWGGVPLSLPVQFPASHRLPAGTIGSQFHISEEKRDFTPFITPTSPASPTPPNATGHVEYTLEICIPPLKAPTASDLVAPAAVTLNLVTNLLIAVAVAKVLVKPRTSRPLCAAKDFSKAELRRAAKTVRWKLPSVGPVLPPRALSAPVPAAAASPTPSPKWDIGDEGGDWTPEWAERYAALLDRFSSTAFASSDKDITLTDKFSAEVILKDDFKIVFRRPYHQSKHAMDFQDKYFGQLHDIHILVKAPHSPWQSPSFTVEKKDVEGNWSELRSVQDFTATNDQCAEDKYEMPHPLRTLKDLGGAKYFTVLDIKSAYRAVPIKDAPARTVSGKVLPFSMRDVLSFYGGPKLGRVQFVSMPMGWLNSAATLQRGLESIFANVPSERSKQFGFVRLVIYHDDLLLMADTKEGLMALTEDVLEVLADAKLRVSAGKCHFGKTKVSYLGYELTPEGIRPLQDRVEAMANLPEPTTISGVRSILGAFNFYSQALHKQSEVIEPLRMLLKKDARFRWGPEQKAAFQELKRLLTTAPLLIHPKWDRAFILTTDWSNKGISAVLSQIDDDLLEKPVAYHSRSCNSAEANYSSVDGEALAVVDGFRTYHYFLYGHPHKTILYTDSQVVSWLMTSSSLSGKLQRTAAALSIYRFEIRHRPGVENTVADCLSRAPLPSTVDTTGAGQYFGALPPPDLSRPVAPFAAYMAVPLELPPDTFPYPAPMASFAAFLLRELPEGDSYDGGGTVDGFQLPPPLQDTEWERIYHTNSLSPEDTAEDEETAAGLPTALAAACMAVALASALITDVWLDTELLYYLQSKGEVKPHWTKQVFTRIHQAAKQYRWENGELFRCISRDPSPEWRKVPPPGQRPTEIQRAHENVGHLGADRTLSLLRTWCYWVGMTQDVQRFVRACPDCAQVNAVLGSPGETLHPLPLQYVGFRWHADITGPFPSSPEGFQWLAVWVEAATKWVEAFPLVSRTADQQAEVAKEIMARFGAMAQVVVDSGREWQGHFSTLMRTMSVDLVTTSRENPQGNGQAERIIQVLGTALKKYCRTAAQQKKWPRYLPVILAGYRFSKGRTGFSPYQLLTGRTPLMEAKLATTFLSPIQFDDFDKPEVAAELIKQRAEALERDHPMALGNSQIAQHRDTLRYARRRSGAYLRQLRPFEKGDLVYVKLRPDNKLQPAVGPTILMVDEVLQHGRYSLIGADGMRIVEHIRNMGRCHLPNVDTRLIAERLRSVDATRCAICKFADYEELLLMCDMCNRGYHVFCLGLEDGDTPAGVWYCPECTLQRTRLRPLPQLPGPPQAQAQPLVLQGEAVGSAPLAITAAAAAQVPPCRAPDFVIFVLGRPVSPLSGSAADIGALLCSLMGGCPQDWSVAYCTRLAESLPYGPLDPVGQPLCVPTPVSAYRDLCNNICLPAFGTTLVLDPFAGTGTARRALAPLPVVTNDINPAAPTQYHVNMLQPSAVAALASVACGLRPERHAVVTSPQYVHLDIALPLLVQQVDTVCCVFTHAGFLEDHMPARGRYLSALSRAGRLRIVTCNEIMPHRRVGIWICVCAGELSPLMAHQGGDVLHLD